MLVKLSNEQLSCVDRPKNHHTYLSILLIIRSIHSSVRVLTYPPIYLSTYLLNHQLIYPLTHQIIYLPTYLPTHPPIYLPTQSSTYLPPTHQIINLPTYLPTYLPWSSSILLIEEMMKALARKVALTSGLTIMSRCRWRYRLLMSDCS